jgi:hypothetical protein
MSFSETSNQLKETTCAQGFHQRGRPILDLGRVGSLLDLTEDEELAKALRVREEVFNEDALPAGTELEAPQDFYAATKAERAARGRKQASPNLAAHHKGSIFFPHLAA